MVQQVVLLVAILCWVPGAAAKSEEEFPPPPNDEITFSGPGAHNFTVPAGVTQITVYALGAAGGTKITDLLIDESRGGPGGVVNATLQVTRGRCSESSLVEVELVKQAGSTVQATVEMKTAGQAAVPRMCDRLAS